MARYIDAEALKKHFPHDEDWDCPVNTNSLVCELIDAQPTADVDYERGFIEGYTKAESDIFHGGKYAPVKHGRWIYEGHIGEPSEPFYSCSICQYVNYKASKFCPNCGAKMDEEVNHERTD